MWFSSKIVDPEVRLPGFHSQLHHILLLGPCKLLPLHAQLPDLANNTEGYPVKSIADKQQICLQYWGHAYSKHLFMVYLQLKFHWHLIFYLVNQSFSLGFLTCQMEVVMLIALPPKAVLRIA